VDDQRPEETVPRLALNQREAAASLGMSVTTFKVRVRPYVRYVTLGRSMHFPVSELQKWLDRKARGLG
jgi:hypothetical protein